MPGGIPYGAQEWAGPHLPVPATSPLPPPVPPPYGSAKRINLISSNYNGVPGSKTVASRVLDIKVLEHDGATRVVILTDGPVRTYDDFALILPNRLAFDVYYVQGSFDKPVYRVGTREVSALRWGPHSDMVRIVLDLPPGDLPFYTVQRTEQGIEIIIYSGRTISQAPISDYYSYTARADTNPRNIAREVYGDENSWRRIIMANPEIFPYEDPYPDQYGVMNIPQGKILRIPGRK